MTNNVCVGCNGKIVENYNPDRWRKSARIICDKCVKERGGEREVPNKCESQIFAVEEAIRRLVTIASELDRFKSHEEYRAELNALYSIKKELINKQKES